MSDETNLKLPINKKSRPERDTGDAAKNDEINHKNPNRHEIQPIVNRAGTASNNYVIENRHNASIVLGRDFEYDLLNDTDIGMVDITAGRVPNVNSVGIRMSEEDGATESAGDMIADAAKIYVSQKTDIDALYGFTPPNPSINRSAVGIKADAVRLVSRDPAAGIRLIVQPDSTGPKAGRNSQGGVIGGVQGGVELIGPGDEKLQYLVKSDDLAESLGKLVGYIEALEVMVWDFVSYQKKFNSAVSQATDIEAFYAQKGIPDPLLIKSNAKCSLDLFSYVENAGRSIMNDLKKYKVSDLGLTKSGENTKKTGEPVFSSNYHKLN